MTECPAKLLRFTVMMPCVPNQNNDNKVPYGEKCGQEDKFAEVGSFGNMWEVVFDIPVAAW